jgi:hypothetical protein
MQHPELLTNYNLAYIDTGAHLRTKFAWGLHVYVLRI